LEASEPGIFPATAESDYWNDAAPALPMKVQGLQEFDTHAVLGVQEILADDQQDNLRPSEIVAYLVAPILACDNFAVIPFTDYSLSSQWRDALDYFVADRLIFMSIAAKYIDPTVFNVSHLLFPACLGSSHMNLRT
jgi:hypothetical protein